MTTLERYLLWAILCFVSALIYIFFFMKRTEGKELSVKQKILYSVLVALVVPLLILFVFKALGIGIFAQGG